MPSFCCHWYFLQATPECYWVFVWVVVFCFFFIKKQICKSLCFYLQLSEETKRNNVCWDVLIRLTLSPVLPRKERETLTVITLFIFAGWLGCLCRCSGVNAAREMSIMDIRESIVCVSYCFSHFLVRKLAENRSRNLILSCLSCMAWSGPLKLCFFFEYKKIIK